MAEKRSKKAAPVKTEKPEKKPKAVPEKPEGYEATQKAKLTPELRRALALRRRISDKRPTFLRAEWFRHPRLGMKWRKPKGDHAKLRTHQRYRINSPSPGYRSPASVRGLHPSGFREVLVYTPRELEGLDPESQAVRIGSGVGLRKRALIVSAAEDKGLRVLNGGVGK